ncbi:GH92 family glycosyl hydrolase [Botrimarina hoheduenensis]|uniref:Glycosyl hydrolase family 92 n=1 Tax=Botrimarina hoheduenensis TaxID=2528000 RepID=A0A5C5VY88_9BACT|nr:GH92 family glycosyl hydrolase [Botrimarina hoheduenensis]TWT42903.1 Glycosyl hydrolase family 92 [Botrimarina hoheduenensis]
MTLRTTIRCPRGIASWRGVAIATVGVVASLACGQDPVRSVDPLIGTGGSGHCFPGATTPHGMVQLSPDTRDTGWDACGGYHYDDRTILGFSHTHISGTGVEEMGDLLFAPTVGEVLVVPGAEDAPEKGYRNRFSHKSEIASPGYYAVTLEDDDIRVEATAAPHVGVLRLGYPRGAQANLVIDLNHGFDRQRRYGMPETLLDAYLRVEDDHTLSGYRISSGWADLQEVYFVIEFSEPIVGFGMYDPLLDRVVDGVRHRKGGYSATKADVRGYVRFAPSEAKPVLVRTGLSSVSVEGARRNLHTEVDHWDFDRVKREAEAAWRERLSKIEISADARARRIFYTALYHLHLAPTLLSDVDGAYLGVDNRPAVLPGGYYSTLSLWDTFRAVKPLYTILAPELSGAIVRTMLAHHDRQGYLPMWTAWGKETHAMLANHAIPVVTEAVLKGIDGVDPQAAWQAVSETSFQDHHASPFSLLERYGYFPSGVVPWSVSQTVEVAYDDACAAKLARRVGDLEAAVRLEDRSQAYRRLFDRQTQAMRPRDVKGAWITPFQAESIAHGSEYKEGSALQYSWFVPHDVQGLADLFGSRNAMADRLDRFFSEPLTVESHIDDVTGFYGQYAHGNEVSHHAAYLFNRLGRPRRTQEIVREVRDRFYTDAPDGIVGNEDCGQMSAWFVLSALGFYPIDPCSLEYELGIPAYEQVTIHLPSGKQMRIEAPGVHANHYVMAVTLNGKPLSGGVLKHAELLKGGTLYFQLTNKPLADGP